jgi:dipeptide/tripeptide permease
MGINLGAMIAPLFCGYLGEVYGWHWGFGAAGIGMLAGLLVFWKGIPFRRNCLKIPGFFSQSEHFLDPICSFS